MAVAVAAPVGSKRSYLFEDEYSFYPTQKKARHHALPVFVPRPEENTDPISPPPQIPTNGAGEWVEYFVREMLSAISMEDAKSRAARAVEALEQAVAGRVGEEAARHYGEEAAAATARVEVLGKENAVLRRAVGIQQQRLAEKEKELNVYREATSQCEEKIKILEAKNYGLTVHLSQALGGCGNSFTAYRGNPDVF
ncbi:hypothetical protein Tsubulata_000289 [Turnera subulata]|uniref:Uncharacterized protein n=1 Tax=Turnera subulata TaxID=218843 RepID=A0A9Q0F2V9_9ROSI|nr:hypothetical protein Tsubulata_000289 [Turnera subulata]